ncbi:MAG: metallophosphoesterase, partial [Opitutaceae bacterium]
GRRLNPSEKPQTKYLAEERAGWQVPKRQRSRIESSIRSESWPLLQLRRRRAPRRQEITAASTWQCLALIVRQSFLMRRSAILFFALIALLRGATAAEPRPEAILVVVADQHSAYERTAQFVAHIDRLRAGNPGVPFAVLIDGDALEFGNVVARRTAGTVDFALFAALAQRAPTVINLGNHEPEFHDVPETVKRLQAAGLTVISGNLRDRATGKPFAPASARLKLGAHDAVIVGVTTDWLDTYRVAIRPQISPAAPAAWATENFPALLKGAPLPIVLSHAGLAADREMLPLVPDGTLFAGAHDHLRFVHRAGRTVYFHSGSWMSHLSVARLYRTGGALQWELDQVPLRADDPADPALAKLIRETLARHLTAEELAVVGRTPRALSPDDAARFAVEAARRAASADAAIVGATTFGAGLPAGEVTRFALDACVRFDGTLWYADVSGMAMNGYLTRANRGPDTPLADRSGENLIAAVSPGEFVPERRYRLVVTDWIARNAQKYLGHFPPEFREMPELKLKSAAIEALKN